MDHSRFFNDPRLLVLCPDFSQPARSYGDHPGSRGHTRLNGQGDQRRNVQNSGHPGYSGEQDRRSGNGRCGFCGKREEGRLHHSLYQFQHYLLLCIESGKRSVQSLSGFGTLMPGGLCSAAPCRTARISLEVFPGAGQLHEAKPGKDPREFDGGGLGRPLRL